MITTSTNNAQIINENTELDIYHYANKYFVISAENRSSHTERAKKSDIIKFLNFFASEVQAPYPSLWTPAITRGFQKLLMEKENYAATSINRIMATIQHFANWISKAIELECGNPSTGYQAIRIEEPSWNAIPPIIIEKLKLACANRTKLCKKLNQNPMLETLVFYLLLTTGIRESELSRLNIEQYSNGCFHNIIRKGNKITKIIYLPENTKIILEKYLKNRKNIEVPSPLLITRYGNRISTKEIARICSRIAKQASTETLPTEAIKLTPHMLRHTFLKQIADKHGIHVAQEFSGNISIKEIFRYTKPSSEERKNIIKNLY